LQPIKTKEMKHSLAIIALGTVFLHSCTGQDSTNKVDLKTDIDSVSYAMGVAFGADVKGYLEGNGLDTVLDMNAIIAGIRHVVNDESKIEEEEAFALIQSFQAKQGEKRAAENTSRAEKFLAENGAKPNVITTESGLQYVVLQEGTGDAPSIMDQVKVHYTGKLLNGTTFDSSEDRGEPVTFYLRQVIPGWTEMLQLMKPGSKVKAFIPGQLAYGPNGGPQGSGIGPNELLVFDIHLIDVIKDKK